MGQIDLKGMIDQILGMVKDSQAAKQAQSTGWYGGNKDEEEYWKDIRKRNTDMGLQEMKGENELAVRGATEAGATARQKLMGDTERYKSDQSLTAEKYRSDQSLAGTMYQSDRLKSDMKDSPGNILFDAKMNSMDKSPQAMKLIEDEHAKIFGSPETWGKRNMTPQNQAPAQQDAPTDWSASEKPDAPKAPAVSPSVAPTAPAPVAKPIDYASMSEDEMKGHQVSWIKKNPDATVAGDSPLIMRRNQIREKKKQDEAVAAKNYNQKLVQDSMAMRDPAKQKQRRIDAGLE
jgi:hypothetical protein